MLLASETKKHMAYFGFSLEFQETLVLFWIFNPTGSKIQKITWMFLEFQKTQKIIEKTKKTVSRLHGCEVLDVGILGFFANFVKNGFSCIKNVYCYKLFLIT